MTTDREMLEWAAKAAGVFMHPEDKLHRSYGNWGCDTTCMVCKKDPSDATFRPLTRDSDAFKLAISCGLSIEPYPYYDMPKHSVIVKQRRRGDQMRETNPTEVVEVYGDNPAAATRRAIVRAAASIGQQMEGK